MTNDEVREVIKSNGITVEKITFEQLAKLHERLSKSLESSSCFRGTFRMNEAKDPMYTTCRSDYFADREAVSFNRDGFIGMAGWASTENVNPIREAVLAWAYDIGSD